MYRLFAIIIIQIFSFLSSQDIWGGVSVAMPDNLNAISKNPAGLGINRGEQSGFYFQFDSLYTNSSSYRKDGIGFDLTYNQFSHGIFKPTNGNIGFGFSLFQNTWLDVCWVRSVAIIQLAIGGIFTIGNFSIPVPYGRPVVRCCRC